MAFVAMVQALAIFRMTNPGSLEVDLIFRNAQMSLGTLCKEGGRLEPRGIWTKMRPSTCVRGSV